MGSRLKSSGTIIGDYLRMAGLITGSQFDEAVDHVKQFGGLISTYLLHQGYIERYSIAGLLTRVYGFPLCNVDEGSVDLAAVRLLTWPDAKKWMALPVGFHKGGVQVAMTEPVNAEALREIENRVQMPVRPGVVAYTDLVEAFHRCYDLSDEEYETLTTKAGVEDRADDLDISDILDSLDSDDDPEPEVEVDHDLLVKLCNQILIRAVKEGATHVHIEPFQDRVAVRFRIDGRLRHDRDIPKSYQQLLATRFKILGETDITERRIPQNGRINLKVQGREIEFYLVTFPTRHGEALVLEAVEKRFVDPNLESIGLTPFQIARIEEALKIPYGLIVIGAPARSGRTVTAYAALKARLTDDVKAVTIEDRIKLSLDGVLQTTIQPYQGFDLPRALAAVRLLDPDVCLLGSLPDEDTLKQAMDLAASGCLVIARTLAEDAAAAAVRLFDLASNRSRLAGMLHLCVSQRLLRTLCPECKQPIASGREELPAADSPKERHDVGTKMHEAIGCPACGGSGYRGRTAIFECLKITPKIKKALVNGVVESKLREEKMRGNIDLLAVAAMNKLAEGITSLDEALLPFP